jgi:uncharacterized protein (DUF1501 family)
MQLDRPLVPAIGITRRQLLRSSLAMGAFVLPAALGRTAQAAPPRRRARGVILVMLEGGMSHLDTWDPKPNAPAEVRGEFGTIATTLPGLRVGEHLSQLAQQAHRFNLIRSVHCDARNDHSPGTHLVMTGWEYLAATAGGGLRETTNLEHPSQGAIIARQLGLAAPNGVPRFVAIPARKHRVGTTYCTAAFLGSAHEAFESGSLPANGPTLPPALVLPREVSLRRLDDRQALRERFDRLNARLDRDPTVGRMDAHYQRAVSILASSQMREAFDLRREKPALRQRYGSSSLLLARRLVESGASYVLVNGPVFGDWDTHSDNFSRLRQLVPPMDRAVSALLDDLDQRGLLDEILVVLISEMGRSRVVPNAGRDHWTAAYSVMLAGGGLTRGQVLGSTTSKGEWPGQRPVTVPEILATVYHRLGIDSNTLLYDAQKRLILLLPDGARPISELIA